MTASIYTLSGFIDDRWQRRDTAAGLLAGEQVLLPPRAFHTTPRDQRDPDTIGVFLSPDDDVRALAADLDTISMIAIDFPKFSDGRGYSQAARLRGQSGYKGRLRATGDVLLDQVQHFFRCGFDELAIESAETMAALKAGHTLPFSRFYQPAVGEAAAIDRGQGRVWRRAV